MFSLSKDVAFQVQNVSFLGSIFLDGPFFCYARDTILKPNQPIIFWGYPISAKCDPSICFRYWDV